MPKENDNLMHRARSFFAPPEQHIVGYEKVVRLQDVPRRVAIDSSVDRTNQPTRQVWVDLGRSARLGRYKSDVKRVK